MAIIILRDLPSADHVARVSKQLLIAILAVKKTRQSICSVDPVEFRFLKHSLVTHVVKRTHQDLYSADHVVSDSKPVNKKTIQSTIPLKNF